MNAPAKRQISINDLEQSPTGPVWVVNSSGERHGGRGNVVINVAEDGSAALQVAIPVTWIPVNLTEQVPKTKLLASSNFRRALARKMLTLVSNEDAERLLSEDGASVEQDRVSKFNIGGGENANMDNIKSSDDASLGRATEQQHSAFVMGILGRIPEMTVSDIEIMNTIRSSGVLKFEEYRAISKEAKNNNRIQLRTWCREQIEAHYPDKIKN